MNIPKDLLMKIASGDCIVFVGAGLSLAAGLPNWKKLLLDMLDWGEAEEVEIPDKTDIESSINNNKFLLAAEEIIERMGDENFSKYILEKFSISVLIPTQVHKLLTKIPFAAAITTNYDDLLEKAYGLEANVDVFTQQDIEKLSNALKTRKFYILKAHGTLERPETIVLGRNQYRKVMHDNPAYREFLSTLFSTKTILFIGFSLSDPDLELVLNELQTVFAGFTGTHYALINSNEMYAFEQKRWATDYNIEIIPYVPSAVNHPEVSEFLTDIIAALPKYILFQTMNERLNSAKQVLDADPYYHLVLDTDNRITVHERYEGAAEDNPLEHRLEFKFDENTPEGREAHQAFNKLLATGEKVTIKSPHIANIISPELFKPFLPDVIESMEITMGPIVGESDLPVKFIFEPIEGEPVVLDNIILKNIQGGDEQTILSNEHQGIPWNIHQTLRSNENESTVRINFSEIGLNVKQALEGWRKIEAFSKGGHFRIESLETGRQLGQGKIEPNSYPKPNPTRLRLLEALTFIQSKTSATFKTFEDVSEYQAQIIFFLEEVLKTGHAQFNATPYLMKFNLEQAQIAYEQYQDGNQVKVDSFIDGYGAKIMGEFVDLGPVITSQQLYVEPEVLEGLKNFIDGNTEELYEIQFTPVPNTLRTASFIDWLPTKEGDQLRNSAFVRINSLQALIRTLFESSKFDDGSFDIDKFINFLEEAKSQKDLDGNPINLLVEGSEDELKQAFIPILLELTEQKRKILELRLNHIVQF